jgi:hypothetical protein
VEIAEALQPVANDRIAIADAAVIFGVQAVHGLVLGLPMLATGAAPEILYFMFCSFKTFTRSSLLVRIDITIIQPYISG